MKFIHIADMHLGKMLKLYNLLPLQEECLQQVTEALQNEDIDGLIIAGDVYDRAIPPQEAVNVLNRFLSTIINDLHKKVYMISGNHDSSDRLNFASSILESTGLYIETRLQKQIVYHQEEDVRIYMLPFVRPIDIRRLYPECPTTNYNEAFAYYLSQQEPLDHHYKNILITHQFVGFHAITSESEQSLSVGNAEVIDPSLFDDFDYVALGHLHAPQYVHQKHIRYSGSLAKYSFDEVKQKKGYVMVDTENMHIEEIEFKMSQDVVILKDRFENLNNPANYQEHQNDLIAVELTDTSIIPHAIEHLRMLYPHILQLTYPALMGNEVNDLHHMDQLRHTSLVELYEDFYQQSTGTSIDEASLKIIQDLLEGGENHEAS
ncbi:exonuclease SbcCD subunit D [Sharpea porci]|uniref:exonuclease SbcCD subunit D n=1 Tax=Sharpea porci TaxID=2652286 RepID=UPI002A91E040|nr:exonuclease SbcCD subunit D [Sharpea porci]MDY5280163.1 exonuclease SbcCD subunit D [Sharpea porci]